MKRSRSFVIAVSLLIVAGVTATVVFFAAKTSEKRNGAEPVLGVQPASIQRSRAAVVQEVINRIEQHSGRFAQRIRQAFSLLEHPELADALALPFELCEINQHNPNRNYPEFLQRAKGNGFQQANVNYYAYELSSSPGMAATFSPATRCMDVDRHFDPANALDWLVLYHETYHVAQDNNWRVQLDSQDQLDAYLAFHMMENPPEPRIIINYETTAYAYELECLNLLTRDELRQAVTVGRYNLERLRVILNARPDQQGMIEMLWLFALAYWPDGTRNNQHPPPFVRHVVEAYQARGYELYTTNQGR